MREPVAQQGDGLGEKHLSTVRVSLVASVAALGGFLFGFDTAVINGAIGALEKNFTAHAAAVGLSVSSALLGAAAGAVLAGRLADRHGRTRTMLATSLLFVASAAGSGAAVSPWDFSAWRVLGGVAIGAASVVVPAYIAEIAPAHLRGRLGSLQQLAIVLGIFVALLVDYAIAVSAGSAASPFWFGASAWRWMFWSAIPPALLYGVGALLIPESPRYLAARGRLREALVVLRGFIGEAAQARLLDIQRTLSSEHRPRLADLRGRFGLLPIVWIGIGLSAFQQLVGINVIFYYSSVLWQAVGFSERSSLVITVITGVTNIVTTLVAIAAVDRIGRKPLLVAGSIGMALTLGTMAAVFGTAGVDASGSPVLEGAASLVALLSANLYVFCFGASWGPVTWVLLGEMFENRIRALALSIAAAAQWLANFLVSATFPALKMAGLGIAYGLYTAAAAASLVFVIAFIPETKGKELEEM
ncbi:sugar porter family MFS transporter [Sorangium sp. So ce1151]|uniref:sugar porter family MFS transporter n=1 Tax=Sorangium sp. So ce1151 TaxID=3133332 RepID=UPI003F60B1DE